METKHFSRCPAGSSGSYTDCICEKTRYWKLFYIALAVMILEIIGGIMSNSNSLLADSVHVCIDLSNIFCSIIVIYLAKDARFNEDKVRGYGKNFGIILLLIGVFLIGTEAVKKLQHPEKTISWLMFSIAVIGAWGNYYMGNLLHDAPEEEKNITNKMAHLHVMMDLLMSWIVIASSVVIWITGWMIVDPAMSLILCLFLIYNVIHLAKDNNHCEHNHHH